MILTIVPEILIPQLYILVSKSQKIVRHWWFFGSRIGFDLWLQIVNILLFISCYILLNIKFYKQIINVLIKQFVMVKICLNRFLLFETVKINENFVLTLYVIIKLHIQGVFDVEVFLLICDSIRCSKEF
jgi:hypothetical protein